MRGRPSASACLANETRVFGFVGCVILLEDLIVVATPEQPAHFVRRMRAQRPARVWSRREASVRRGMLRKHASRTYSCFIHQADVPLKTLTLLKHTSNTRCLELSQRPPRKPREPPERRRWAIRHPTRAGIGLVSLGDSDFVPANPEDDLRGKDAYDAQGQPIGSVEDLYIDPQEREVRFLEVGAGGFLGIGQKPFLVPVEAITLVAEDRVTIEPGRTEK